MNSYCKSFLFILLLIIILFLGFYRLSSKKNIYEHYNNIETYDKYILINSISNYVIIIEGNINGIIINAASTEKNASTYSYLKMNLNQNYSDIFDIQNVNGQYWYFNYSSNYGTLGTNTNSCSNEKNGQIIDLSQYNQNQIFENAIFFKNGTMITFDLTGTHMIIGKIPQVNSISKVQIICALTQQDMTNLNGNSMTILYNNNDTIEFFNPEKKFFGNFSKKMNKTAKKIKKTVVDAKENSLNTNINNFYYNGGCDSNKYGTTENNVNFMQTLAIFSPTNKNVSILSFNNGCFIDGSQSGSLLRFIGNSGTIQFDLSGNYDILQIWNLTLSNYFYYNVKNQIGISKVQYSTYTLSQKNRNYWNMLKLGMFPYTQPIQTILDNSNILIYKGIDQIIIYNPNSKNNLAILIQVDTCPYGVYQGNNLPQGSNNWSLTISSIFYNPKTKTISLNLNAVSKFSFNLNCGQGDILDFIVNNGNSVNNTMYFRYNSDNELGNLVAGQATVSKSVQEPYGSGGTNLSVYPNNYPYGNTNSKFPSVTYPYAFRNNPPNQLIFENTITFVDNLQMGIDINGNCIIKGPSIQTELNIAKTNMDKNINIYGIDSSGNFNPVINNFSYNGNSNKTSIGTGIRSGTIQLLENVEQDANYTIIKEKAQVINETSGDFDFGISIPDKTNSNGGPFWSYESIQNDLKNGYILIFPNGYQNSYGTQVGKNSIALIDFKKITPLNLISESTTNIINGNTQENPISELLFSNNINIIANGGIFGITGLFGFFGINTGNNSDFILKIQNNSLIMNGQTNKNLILNNTGDNSLEFQTVQEVVINPVNTSPISAVPSQIK